MLSDKAGTVVKVLLMLVDVSVAGVCGEVMRSALPVSANEVFNVVLMSEGAVCILVDEAVTKAYQIK